ncbi:MAG: PEP-CTERM sorting domain-containing protein [Planctomycetota bacterium]
MKLSRMIFAVALLALIASPALAKTISIPDFATDPSGLGYTISAMTPGYGDTNNVSDIDLYFGQMDDSGMDNMLRMNWQPVDGDLPSQAGWSLVFGTDPDVTNHTLKLSIRPPGAGVPGGPPGGMTHVEVHIVDINNLDCGGWGFNTDQFWAVPPGIPLLMGNDPGAAGQAPVPFMGTPEIASMAQGTPAPGGPPFFVHNVTINIGNGPVAGSATVLGPTGLLTGPNYIIAPAAGSDLTQAKQLDFYENGVLQVPNVAIPIGFPAGLNNWWTNIQLAPIPEPGALPMLGLGVLGLAARRKRR